MYPEWPPEEVLSLLGIRGCLESELGPEGGGCCGRVDAACGEWEGCAEVQKDVIIEIVDDVADQIEQKKKDRAKGDPKPDPPD